MSTEDKIKELILQRYRSIREFTQIIDMSYSTMDSILKRGIENASISNVIKICKELGISADELADGKVVPTGTLLQARSQMTDISEIVNFTKTNLAEYDGLSLDGKPLKQEDVKILINALDIGLELIRRNRLQ